MAFVTSRGFTLPDAPADMDGSVWFSLWQYRLWPYDELEPGDDLYWYETPTRRIVWKTRVSQVDAFPYESLDSAFGRIRDVFDFQVDRHQEYLHGKAASGYCLAYRVEAIEKLDLLKPDGVRFNQLGCGHGTRPEITAWLVKAG